MNNISGKKSGNFDKKVSQVSSLVTTIVLNIKLESWERSTRCQWFSDCCWKTRDVEIKMPGLKGFAIITDFTVKISDIEAK